MKVLLVSLALVFFTAPIARIDDCPTTTTREVQYLTVECLGRLVGPKYSHPPILHGDAPIQQGVMRQHTP